MIFLHILCYSKYLTESLLLFMLNKTFVIVIVIAIAELYITLIVQLVKALVH